MSKPLNKQGLRKCYVCKKILPLTPEYFYRNKANQESGFDKRCKECSKIREKSRIRDKEKARVNHKRYYAKHHEELRQKNLNRRLGLRFNIFQKYDYTCQYCGRKVPEITLEVDHKYPKSKGGLDKVDNYTVACRDCNLGKGDCILNEFKK